MCLDGNSRDSNSSVTREVHIPFNVYQFHLRCRRWLCRSIYSKWSGIPGTSNWIYLGSFLALWCRIVFCCVPEMSCRSLEELDCQHESLRVTSVLALELESQGLRTQTRMLVSMLFWAKSVQFRARTETKTAESKAKSLDVWASDGWCCMGIEILEWSSIVADSHHGHQEFLSERDGKVRRDTWSLAWHFHVWVVSWRIFWNCETNFWMDNDL